ncbi:MAG: hypothetical protein ABSB91_06830 [Sedimentisphaerales bacterium]
MENVRKMPFWRRAALILVLTGVVMVVGLMLVTYVSSRQLGNEIVKISKAGEPTAFPVVKPPQGTTEDANRYYAEAIGLITPGELTNISKVYIFYRIGLTSLPANQFPADLRDKVTENLTKSQPILTNLDKGAGLWLSWFDTGLSSGKQLRKDRLDSIQAAVILSSLRTLDYIRAGNLDKAADSIATSLKLLRVFDGFPTVHLQSRKMASLQLVCGDIHLLLQRNAASSDPNAPLLKAKRLSPQRLEMLQSLLEETLPPDTLEKTLLAERVSQIEIARNLLPKSIVSKYLSANVPVLPERRSLPSLTWHRMRLYRAFTKLMRDMAWCVRVSRLPWPGPLEQAKDANQAPSGGNSGIVPVIGPLTRLSAETLATVRGTATLIAIERYRQREKKFPDSLALLIPTYLKSVPLDPFSGEPIVYSHDAQTCKLSGALEQADANRPRPAGTDAD